MVSGPNEHPDHRRQPQSLPAASGHRPRPGGGRRRGARGNVPGARPDHGRRVPVVRAQFRPPGPPRGTGACPARREDPPVTDDALWYKDAIFYELHVRAFLDSDASGSGDFRGLTSKLDYLHDLGVTTLWLLPFYPSPLRDDGYDISDYASVHPSYGTLSDVKTFLKEAHRRGLRVVTELVLNHTSDQHPWFQRARRAPPNSRWRNFYVWSDTPERFLGSRVIFKDFEGSNWTWDSVARSYFWHRFYSHQPDLNFDSPEVRRALRQVVDFWFGLGVDGLRLDAVPYLFEREGTNCENLPETHAFLKSIRRHVDERVKGRMLLAEANQWPEDAAAYFGQGDECHMAFHFPIMPRMFMSIHMEDRFPLVDILQQTPVIPETTQWAIFLRNHDELTLEMVTDEERDYMYRVYATDPQARINLGIRRRLAPLLGNNRRKIELMNGLLFSLPGTPVIYYGDEIGMGDNIYLGDRNGVRTPMQWSADRNAGFSRANPQRLYLPIIIDPEYHYEAINVEAQQNNPHSLLWWMKRMIALRKRHKAFSRGTIEFLFPENRKILAFIRHWNDESLLIVANLSRFTQFAELDLSAYRGTAPLEMFGRTDFPPIGERPYLLTLGPHTFYWFDLRPMRPAEAAGLPEELRTIDVPGSWESVFSAERRPALEEVLQAYLPKRRWFRSKGRRIKSVSIKEAFKVPCENEGAYLTTLHVEYLEDAPETYALPLAFAPNRPAAEPGAVARLKPQGGPEGVLYDPTGEKAFSNAILDLIARRRRLRGRPGGEIHAIPTRAFRRWRGTGTLESSLLKAEQTNSSVLFGDRLILKIYRRLDEGINPDLEIGTFLTEGVAFPHTPDVAGQLELRRPERPPVTVATLQQFLPNQGDAWTYTLDQLGLYFERVLAAPPDKSEAPVPTLPILDLTEQPLPPLAQEMIAAYLESARLIGQRTAELHAALASTSQYPDFAPEPFSELYQRSLYQSMRSLGTRVFQQLRRSLPNLPASVRDEAHHVLGLEPKIMRTFQAIVPKKLSALRIRIHGDYHLGQLLYTGKDFVIIDFEGEPARPLSERRFKRSPLRDVAGMLRSFQYAAASALMKETASGEIPPERLPAMEAWGRYWQRWISSAFLKAYLEVAAKGSFLPKAREELRLMLNLYILEKAVYELGYELNNRPEWLAIPLKAISELME
ncbi:MAG: maltose alpha-D-glucosyltransferase [Planctomycetes bacterium]|nr:maltose alpha-D-glucosyltransferase [Planctomycetota bacterium]